MATPPQIDIEALLRPIPADPRPGPDADRESVYAAFRQALRAEDVAARDPRAGGGHPADLGGLIERGGDYLARRTKDLVIAAWMTEALTQSSGVAGLRDGLVLIRGLLADCWEDCHPPLGRDGDAELRARPLEALASARSPLLLRLRRTSLGEPQVGGTPFCFLDIRKGSTDLTEAEIESGPIGEAVRRSSRRFFERLVQDVRQAREAGRELVLEARKRFPVDQPDLSLLDRALAEYQEIVERLLAIKLRQEPGPESNGPAPAGRAPAPEPDGMAATGRPRAVPGPTRAALDYGRVLIAFSERARTLADDTERLKKNREEYEELMEKLRQLDAEYEEITGRLARDRDLEPILSRKLAQLPEGPSAG